VVALLVFFVVLIDAVTFFIFVVLSFIGLILWLQTSLLLVLSFSAKASLSLTHLVEFLAADMVVIFKDFVLLITSMLVLQLFNDCISLHLAL